MGVTHPENVNETQCPNMLQLALSVQKVTLNLYASRTETHGLTITRQAVNINKYKTPHILIQTP